MMGRMTQETASLAAGITIANWALNGARAVYDGENTVTVVDSAESTVLFIRRDHSVIRDNRGRVFTVNESELNDMWRGLLSKLRAMYF